MPFCAKTVKWTHLTTRSGLVTAKWFCLKSLTLYSVPSVKTFVLLSFVLRFRIFCQSSVVIESVHHWHKFINPICYFYLPHHFYRFGPNALLVFCGCWSALCIDKFHMIFIPYRISQAIFEQFFFRMDTILANLSSMQTPQIAHSLTHTMQSGSDPKLH